MPANPLLAAPAPVAEPAAALTDAQAAELANLSTKTLKRLAEAGEPVGRFSVGRAVRFHRRVLLAWLDAKAGVTAATATTAG